MLKHVGTEHPRHERGAEFFGYESLSDSHAAVGSIASAYCVSMTRSD
jgi:hypothetical protein